MERTDFLFGARQTTVLELLGPGIYTIVISEKTLILRSAVVGTPGLALLRSCFRVFLKRLMKAIKGHSYKGVQRNTK
jgi:hypothetical protein